MRIGWMIYGSLGKMSGGYLYDRLVVEGLREAGHHVEVISMPDVGWFRALTHNWDANLLEEAIELNLDLLVQDELNHPSLFLFNHSFKQFTKKPIVSVVHHLRSSEKHPPTAQVFYKLVERHYLKTVDAFIFNSEFTKDDVNRLSPLNNRPWVIAYPGKNRLEQRLTEDQVRQRCQTPGPLKLLFVGNIIPRKGLYYLLQALKNLPPNQWELKIVGSQSANASYFSKIQRCVSKHLKDSPIHFLGLQPNLMVRQIYQESQVLILPSDIEGYGIVYAEALGFGLPCLATNNGGAKEVIRDGREGYLVPHANPLVLQTHLKNLIEDRTLLEKLSLQSLRRYDELTAWSDTQEQVKNFLEGLLKA